MHAGEKASPLRVIGAGEWVSSIHPLDPGDVLAPGTNHRGLSAFQDRDQIDLETDGLGRLCPVCGSSRSRLPRSISTLFMLGLLVPGG